MPMPNAILYAMFTYSTGSPCSKPSARHHSTSRSANTPNSKTMAPAHRPPIASARRGAPISRRGATRRDSAGADDVAMRSRVGWYHDRRADELVADEFAVLRGEHASGRSGL